MNLLPVLLKKFWKPLAEILLVAFLLCAAAYWCYSRGYQKADTSWKYQWAQRDLTDATAALQREVTERAKEQRRQHAADEERKRADEELAKIQADADAAGVLAVGCNSSSQQYNGSSQEVKPAGFPLLPQQARQKPRPEYCSPSCLAKLTIWRESSQKRLMSVMSPEAHANVPGTK